jgi:hypothetical protein
VSDVGSDRCRNTQGFLTKNVKEIFWDLEFLSENSGVGSHRFHCTSMKLETSQREIQYMEISFLHYREKPLHLLVEQAL